jgi:hypothetical protein
VTKSRVLSVAVRERKPRDVNLKRGSGERLEHQ